MAERLKDQFFTQASIRKLAETLSTIHPAFEVDTFLNLIYDSNWEALELKAKMHHVTRCFGATLPNTFQEALNILKKAILNVSGFEVMSFPDYVEMYGMEEWDLAMPALAYFTPFGSSEFAVRPFLDRDPARAMVYMSTWAEDPDPSVRRLASEGCRPRLPWAMALPKFKKDPTLIFPVLDKLKNDESEMVRRSVANNLNDISKDNPLLVLDVCGRWFGRSKETDKIVKHACRSLLKAGNPRAMRLFGFCDPDRLGVEGLDIDAHPVKIGDSFIFSFNLRVKGKEKSKVRLEYVVYFVKAKGKLSPKIFQYSEKVYTPGSYSMTKKHSMMDQSTRKHYPGEHQLAIIINGVEKARLAFEVIL